MIANSDIVKEPLLRNQIADYLNCTADGDTADWCLMGLGFNTLDENPNAQEHENTYINQATSASFVKGYKTEFPYECDMMKDEKAVEALYKVGRDHLTGTAAMFEYCRVDLYKGTGSGNSYPARKFIVSAIPSSTSGAGGEYIATSGTLKAVGDFVEGTFNTQTKTFTPTGTGA